MIDEKLKEVEASRAPINFFVPSLIKLLKHTPSDILCEMGMRAFTGSRDVPKDEEKALGLFIAADESSKTEAEKSQSHYFLYIM